MMLIKEEGGGPAAGGWFRHAEFSYAEWETGGHSRRLDGFRRLGVERSRRSHGQLSVAPPEHEAGCDKRRLPPFGYHSQ